jgi:hypothetical protein
MVEIGVGHNMALSMISISHAEMFTQYKRRREMPQPPCPPGGVWA